MSTCLLLEAAARALRSSSALAGMQAMSTPVLSPTRHKRFENALGRHAQIVGHGNSGKILFVHRRAVQRVGNSQFFQQAGGVSFGNFGMR